MIVVRNEGTGNMFGKKSLKSDDPYNKLMRVEARCEEYEEEIAALEDEVEELRKERDELQKELARYKWVSVKDRLPEKDGFYLAWYTFEGNGHTRDIFLQLWLRCFSVVSYHPLDAFAHTA